MSRDAGAVYEMTLKITELLNEIYPTLGTCRYSDEEDEYLTCLYNELSNLNQKNLDWMYPNRHEK